MEKDKFSQVISGIPRFVAVFKLTKVPQWAPELKRGQLLYAKSFDDALYLNKKLIGGYFISAGYVKFIRYEDKNA